MPVIGGMVRERVERAGLKEEQRKTTEKACWALTAAPVRRHIGQGMVHRLDYKGVSHLVSHRHPS